MDNIAEISRNKKQIEELEKLLENSKSKIIEIEHMMAELDVHITHLPDEFQNKKGQFENKLKQLAAHTEVLFKEKSSQARIKLKNIEKDIDLEVNEAVEFALNAPEPDPSELTKYIWAEN